MWFAVACSSSDLQGSRFPAITALLRVACVVSDGRLRRKRRRNSRTPISTDNGQSAFFFSLLSNFCPLHTQRACPFILVRCSSLRVKRPPLFFSPNWFESGAYQDVLTANSFEASHLCILLVTRERCKSRYGDHSPFHSKEPPIPRREHHSRHIWQWPALLQYAPSSPASKTLFRVTGPSSPLLRPSPPPSSFRLATLTHSHAPLRPFKYTVASTFV